MTATLVAHGDTWCYQADGQNLGTAWRQPATDTSAWPTGASQLGWGGKGETTVIPSAPVTDYFVKHVNIPDTEHLQHAHRPPEADDGAAVYINGVEVGARQPARGRAQREHAGVSFMSGAAESTWFEYTVPASLLTNGDNTIAVELHQAQAANNATAIFDLELVARTARSRPPRRPRRS